MRIPLIILLAALFSAQAHAAPLDVEGTWIAMSRGDRVLSHVKIADCGDGTPCGTLVYVDPNGTDQTTDAHSRPLIGARIIGGFARKGDTWHQGWIYNPEDGKTFACALQLDDSQTLTVTGCLGPFCRTNIWKRLPTSAASATP